MLEFENAQATKFVNMRQMRAKAPCAAATPTRPKHMSTLSPQTMARLVRMTSQVGDAERLGKMAKMRSDQGESGTKRTWEVDVNVVREPQQQDDSAHEQEPEQSADVNAAREAESVTQTVDRLKRTGLT